MDQLILAAGACDPEKEIICVPANVNDLFELPYVGGINRTIILILLAGALASALLYFGLRRKAIVPSKFQAAVESIVGFVRDEIAIGIIGPKEGLKYFPYLLSIFLFILIGNLFEVVPFILFPITGRMALPLFLAIFTYVIFVVAGFAKQGIGFLTHTIWPPGVPVALKPLVGIIELVSIFLVRPFSLAVRLFANMVAGHVMLSLLLLSGWVFLFSTAGIGKNLIGVGWLAMGIAIYTFEIIVALLQAYIFTLLSAVYIQTSVHPEH
jgi:F-type H+-transporting ATPase subunit a